MVGFLIATHGTESREHIVPPDTVDGPGDFYGIGTADETDTTVRHDLRKTARRSPPSAGRIDKRSGSRRSAWPNDTACLLYTSRCV